jgi:2-oxoisovalerate dehydrogenase E2 component (dihydrolipoyl transacylase)
VPLIGLRRKIAEKMQESKRRIPHFTYVEEIDVTELEALAHPAERALRPPARQADPAAAADARRGAGDPQVPEVNARFDDEAGIVTRYGRSTSASPPRPTPA